MHCEYWRRSTRESGFRHVTTCLAALILSAINSLAAQADSSEQFELKIRPILATRCFGCHSTEPMGGLSLTSRKGLLTGGKTGPAIVPGDADQSLLIQAVRQTGSKLKMPLGQPKLPEGEIQLLASWVQAGAAWSDDIGSPPAPSTSKYTITPEQRAFWAFQPVAKPSLPAVSNSNWVTSPTDAFIFDKLSAQGLQPNGRANKRDLIRRVYFDLIGVPPTYQETESFVNDTAQDAFVKVVDRLLASPHYGERWARYWLDVARYADDRLDSDVELPYPNSFRYRDWVIQAFNQDMPYDTFVKAQIAGDLMASDKDHTLAIGLGFYGLSPELTDDRVDVTTRGFLALTGACAQCHDHKFDPIPTKDYYALQGVFSSTKRAELELAPPNAVKRYKEQVAKVDDVKLRIQQFLHNQATEMAEILTSDSPRYIAAARKVLGNRTMGAAKAATQAGLDSETLERWVRYLKTGPPDNQYLRAWQDESFDLDRFRREALAVLAERKKVDDENAALQAVAKSKPKSQVVPVALAPERYYLWRDLFFNDFYGSEFKQEEDGILYYGPNRGYRTSDGTIERFLGGPWKAYLENLRAELRQLQSAMPPPYDFAHVIKDVDHPKNERIQIGGQPDNLGDEAPRAFLSILSKGEPKPFQKGSGRLELAEAIASPFNPLTARVMVNRIWEHHFGEGLVRTVSNFGRMGERPSHPELPRLSGDAFRRAGLVDQEIAPRDPALNHLPVVVGLFG